MLNKIILFLSGLIFNLNILPCFHYFDKLPNDIKKEIFQYIIGVPKQDLSLVNLESKNLKEIMIILNKILELKIINKSFDKLVDQMFPKKRENIEILLEFKKEDLRLKFLQATNNLMQMQQIMNDLPYHVNIKDDFQFTGLMWAVENCYKDIVKLFIKNNCDPNLIHPSSYRSALMTACHKNYKSIAKLLILYKNTNINLQNKDGHTALMFACAGGFINIVKLLLKANANISLITTSSQTALTLTRDSKIIELLKKYELENEK